ncbi:hypothetical protein QZH41_011722 [Actinostola sp. cb2023]|nr:hypothetical protein QZH41_011722 [Actinostola sp. cb2023]
MLNSIGLSLHWDSLTKHLDERLDNFQNIINKECPRSSPVILLMDNINMYKGNKRHYRLFKKLSPKMWNFTGRGAIVPNLDGIELLQCESTAVHSQIDFSELTVDDISLDSMADHNQLWSNFLDAYYIKLLKLSLNHIPPASKQFKEMTEAEINIWLSSINFEEFEKLSKPYIIREVSSVFCLRNTVKKTKTLILPLSLEDNSTLPGTASILEEFGKEFDISCSHNDEILEFDEKTQSFDLKGARAHFEFMKILHLHRDEMASLEQQICDTTKQLDGIQNLSEVDDDDDLDNELINDDEQEDEQHDHGSEGSSATMIKKKYFQKQDGMFKKACDKLTQLIWDAIHSQNSATELDILIDRLSNNRWWETKTDHFNRTVLHYAIECNNVSMVRVLLAVGVNPNIKEGCGVTPLHLAVLGKTTEMCKVLVDSLAVIHGLSFSSIPQSTRNGHSDGFE